MGVGAKGFTLVEVLITISLIGVVFGVILTSALALQKRQNDSKRQADLKIIQASLQQYYADNNNYPANISAPGTQFVDGTKVYLNNIPGDPVGNTAYLYEPKDGAGANCSADPQTCINYCLFAKLEGSDPPDAPGCTAVSPNNYSVSQP